MNTIPLKDITCNVDYIILALKYLISPSKSTSKSTQEHRNRIIVTFKAETVHIVLKTQATVGDVSYILQLQAYPGTIYHIATRIIQQHRGELGITEETVSSDFHLTYLLYQQIPGYQSVRA